MRLHFQLSRLTEDDTVDIDDIVSNLQSLTGEHVRVEKTYEILTDPQISPHDKLRWIFLARDQ